MSINLSTRTEIRELGSGGFGNTKLFEDDQKHRFVLKTFAPKGSNDSPKALAMFKSECDRLREVGNHPQIPSYLGFEEAEGQYAIAQEYIPGRSLRQIFDNDDLFTSEQALRLLEDLLDPLEHLHKNKVIHRDIKPANIIIHRVTQKPVLVDFGAAKVATETILAQTGTVIGSFAYAAPEQVAGNGSFQSDIYSLGLVIMESMAGKTPLDTGDWVDWHSAIDGIDQGFIDLLNKMVDRNLRDRFLTFEEVKGAIANLKAAHPAKRKVKGDSSLRNERNVSFTPIIWGFVNFLLLFVAANFIKDILIGDHPLLDGLQKFDIHGEQELIHEAQ